jgi:hypothetical protein
MPGLSLGIHLVRLIFGETHAQKLQLKTHQPDTLFAAHLGNGSDIP